VSDDERLTIAIEVLQEQAEINRKSSKTWHRARAVTFASAAHWLAQGQAEVTPG
jgi:hypothetical protein